VHNLEQEKAAEGWGIGPLQLQLQLQRQWHVMAPSLPASDPKYSHGMQRSYGQASMVIDELADDAYLDIFLK
jgi:hypothetical protein